MSIVLWRLSYVLNKIELVLLPQSLQGFSVVSESQLHILKHRKHAALESPLGHA